MDKNPNSESKATELTTFIGIYIDSLLKAGYKASEVKRMMTQTLVNEALVLCDDNKGSYDYYGLQPLFLAVSYVLEKEVYKLQQEKTVDISSVIDREQDIINYLKNRASLMNNVKGE